MEKVREFGSIAFLGVAVAIFSFSVYNSSKEATSKPRKGIRKPKTKQLKPILEPVLPISKNSVKRDQSLKPIFEIDESTIMEDLRTMTPNTGNELNMANETKSQSLEPTEKPESQWAKMKNSRTNGKLENDRKKKRHYFEEEESSSEKTEGNGKKKPITKKRSMFLSDTDHQKVKKRKESFNEKKEDDIYFYMLNKMRPANEDDSDSQE